MYVEPFRPWQGPLPVWVHQLVETDPATVGRFAPDVGLLERTLLRVRLEGDCWMFSGKPDGGGYGILNVKGRTIRTHVVILRELLGVESWAECDHGCRRRACCSPYHLEPVDPVVNNRRGQLARGVSLGAPTWTNPIGPRALPKRCGEGHEFTTENTYLRPDGNGRQCRTCIRRRSSEQTARRSQR